MLTMLTRRLRRNPLLKLLAVNLFSGVVVATIAVSGLLTLDVHGLRRLILGDQSPALAAALLLFGFVVTFGSWVMGTAIMRIGRDR